MDIRSLVKVRPAERQIAWQELGFTAFIHFGINTFTNREWGNGGESPSLFNPSRLDTDQWCDALKSAGIRACVLTAKHHDGFCLFDSAYTKHSVMSSPCPVDVAASLAASCEKYGVKLGLYLSPWDRHEQRYGSGKEYNDFFCGQLEEIMTRYGKLYSLWFDGACGEGPNGKKQLYDWDRYYELIRRLQPDAVISSVGPDVRWVGNEAGATRQSEWSVVPSWLRDADKIAGESQQEDDATFRERPVQREDLGSRKALENETDLVWYPAEVDVSIRPGWFYHEDEDDKLKPLETLLRFYETAVGGNAVLLLNVPPDREGRIHETDRRRLAELGKAIRNIFGVNLLEGASVLAGTEDSVHPAVNILKDDETYWRPEGETEKAELEIKLRGYTTVSHIELREQIRESQRIEAFTIFTETNSGREKIYEGTTVGFRKICRFKHVETGCLHITIDKSRVSPTLRFVGAYKEGRIHETDRRRLAELGEAIRNIFSVNLLEGAAVFAGTKDRAHPAVNILKDDETYWRQKGEIESVELEIKLRISTTVSHIELREQIRESQRIEAFTVFAETDSGRENVYEGTTVGFRKICRFKPVETGCLHITIDKSRLFPTLRFVGAYKDG